MLAKAALSVMFSSCPDARRGTLWPGFAGTYLSAWNRAGAWLMMLDLLMLSCSDLLSRRNTPT